MPLFRKKPIEVEAEQWFPGKFVSGVYWRETNIGKAWYVITIHGQDAYLEPGDWVITEPDGTHHYPCKPGIFETTYDPA
jgi:hypothetical protein